MGFGSDVMKGADAEALLQAIFWVSSLRKLRHTLETSVQNIKFTIWGFPKIRGTILGVPMRRTIIFWGPYWGPLNLGTYHIPKKLQHSQWEYSVFAAFRVPEGS